ncbi:hypothetical protein [uncultured Limnobacter sp.]|uniref:hypothetical protein n=1 Tax=uncultured Limnobacter sp. TaxID=199681 RepID=UPI0030FA7A24
MPQQKHLGAIVPFLSLIKQQSFPVVVHQGIAQRKLRGQKKCTAFVKQSQGIPQTASTICREVHRNIFRVIGVFNVT